MKTIRLMSLEVRALNTAKGWRDTINTPGEYGSLLHSEISEILEAYRDRGTNSYTSPAGKPDDVGSECADTLIRLLDMCDVAKVKVFDMDCELADVTGRDDTAHLTTFGEWVFWLHGEAHAVPSGMPWQAPMMLRSLVAFCDRWGVDLSVEYERKMAYNRTRPYQHGGRTLSGKDGQR